MGSISQIDVLSGHVPQGSLPLKAVTDTARKLASRLKVYVWEESRPWFNAVLYQGNSRTCPKEKLQIGRDLHSRKNDSYSIRVRMGYCAIMLANLIAGIRSGEIETQERAAKDLADILALLITEVEVAMEIRDELSRGSDETS